MTPRNVPIPLPALAFLVCWGCGSRERAHVGTTVPVKGVVTYQGKPLTGGEISFEPEFGREANGAIQPDGTFVLTTFKEGDGAIPGTHRVAVSGNTSEHSTTPQKYKNATSSKVEVMVTEGKTEYTIDLK
jgi:hypothetical protein